MTKIERKKVIDWKIISCMFWEDRYIKKKQLKGNRTASPQRKIVAQCSLHVMSFKKKKKKNSQGITPYTKPAFL